MGDSEEVEGAGGAASTEEPGASTTPPTKTTEEEIGIGDDNGGLEVDEEDDEFGDFEEAAVVAGKSDVLPTSIPEAVDERHITASAAPPLRYLSEFLNDPSLWQIANDHDDAGVPETSDEEPQPSFYDLVAAFDAAAGGCSNDDEEREGTPEPSASARVMELWLALHCIEETPALQFQWLKSHAYAKLLLALEIPDSTTTLSGNKGWSDDRNSANADQRTLNTIGTASRTRKDGSGGGISSEAEVAVDSLSVPPADFDWQSAGLSNPLKGSSAISNMSVCAMLDCDEFFKTQSAGGGAVKGYDAQSILEKDLQDLGIDVGPASSNLLNGHNIHSAGSILRHDGSKITVDDLLRWNEHRHEIDPLPDGERTLRGVASNKARAYKKREELSSDEARAFYDRLPDLSYMLSDRLIFPAAPPCSEAVRREDRSTDES